MRTNFFLQFLFLVVLPILGNRLSAQSSGKMKDNGLKNKSFIMVGEWDIRHPDSQKMSVVIKGKVVWQNLISLRPSPDVIQEYDDVTMLPNGNN